MGAGGGGGGGGDSGNSSSSKSRSPPKYNKYMSEEGIQNLRGRIEKLNNLKKKMREEIKKKD